MKDDLPEITADILEIVPDKIHEFTGQYPMKPTPAGFEGHRGHEASIVDEIMSAGYAALAEAARYWRPDHEANFKTYAKKCVWNTIRRAAKPRRGDWMGGAHPLVSYTAPVPGRDGSPLKDHDGGNTLLWADVIASVDVSADAELNDAFWARLSANPLLSDRHIEILKLKIAGCTDREIAHRWGISAQRVQQLKKSAGMLLKVAVASDHRARLAMQAPWFYAEDMRWAASFQAHNQISRAAKPSRMRKPKERDPDHWHKAAVLIARAAAAELGVSLPDTGKNQQRPLDIDLTDLVAHFAHEPKKRLQPTPDMAQRGSP